MRNQLVREQHNFDFSRAKYNLSSRDWLLRFF
jgi:hypothetical protein